MLKSRLERPESVLALLRAAHESLDPESIGKLVVNRAEEWFKAPACGVFAADPRRTESPVSRRRAWVSRCRPRRSASRGGCSATDASFASADLRKDPRAMGAGRRRAARGRCRCRAQTVAAPGGDGTAGGDAGAATAPASAQALRRHARGAGAGARQRAAVETVGSLSVTDDLTQLYNSRYLNQVLRREAKRASRSGRPLSLLFLDLDGFKGINDTHGHQAGSRALVEAAAVIRRCARETDVVARFGGDEFAIVLPDTGSEGAAAVGDRVRERLGAHPFLEGNGLKLRLTASVRGRHAARRGGLR